VCPFAKHNKKNNTFKCQKIKKSKELNIDSLNNNIRDDCPLYDVYSYNIGTIKDYIYIENVYTSNNLKYILTIIFHDYVMKETHYIPLSLPKDKIKKQLLEFQKIFFEKIYNNSNNMFNNEELDKQLNKLNIK